MITSKSPRKQKKVVPFELDYNLRKSKICKLMSGWMEDPQRFSLYLDQKAIYLQARLSVILDF